MKTCTVCGELKDFSHFYTSKLSRDGYGYRCKPCDKLARQNTSKSDQAFRSTRARNLMWKYGLTLEAYEDMLLAQGGGCALCGTTNPLGEGNTSEKRSFSFAVDHCHETNVVRGLLCNPCNRGIGFLQDNPELLEKAAEYLRRNRA